VNVLTDKLGTLLYGKKFKIQLAVTTADNIVLSRDRGVVAQHIRNFSFGHKGCEENGREAVIGNT
jgi:hypothetical protein